TIATLNTTSAALVGVVSGDTVILNTAGTTGTFSDKSVGTGKTVTVAGLSISGLSASNYTLTQPTTTADITAKNLTITGVTANNKVYDRTATATLSGTAALNGIVSGDTVTLNSGSVTASFGDKNVGTPKPVTVTGYTISGADAGNYTVSQPTGLAADITAKNLTITGAAANSKVYDRTATATLNFGTANLVGVVSPDAVTINSSAALGTFADKNVGTAKPVSVTGVTLGGADAGNYTVSQPAGLT